MRAASGEGADRRDERPAEPTTTNGASSQAPERSDISGDPALLPPGKHAGQRAARRAGSETPGQGVTTSADAPRLGRAHDPSIYLVTDTALCGGHAGVAATAREAVAGGVSLVQVRDPDASDAAFVALGREVVAALAGTGVPVIVNDRVHLVAEIGAQGAHVGQGDLDPVAARELLGPDGLLGLSVHTDAELDAALALPPGTIDQLGIGPLRATASKPDHEAVRGLAHLAHLAARSPWPCVAIGGVKVGDLPDLRAAGLAGAAVISAICGQPDPRAAAAALRAAWDAAPPPRSHDRAAPAGRGAQPPPDTRGDAAPPPPPRDRGAPAGPGPELAPPDPHLGATDASPPRHPAPDPGGPR